MNEIIIAIEENIQELNDAVRGQLMIIQSLVDERKAHQVTSTNELGVLKDRIETIVKLEVKIDEFKQIESDRVEF